MRCDGSLYLALLVSTASCLFAVSFSRSGSLLSLSFLARQGLRAYLRAAIHYTCSKAVAPYLVHELMDVRYLHGDFVIPPEPFHVDIGRDNRSRDMYNRLLLAPDGKAQQRRHDEKKISARLVLSICLDARR